MKYKLNFEVLDHEYSKVIYGDSVAADTPLLLMNSSGEVFIQNIENVSSKWVDYKGFKLFDLFSRRTEKQYSLSFLKVWTDCGWSPIKKVIRHKTNKEMYGISTSNGYVKVTSDHSLLDSDKKILKPNDCNTSTKLLTSYPFIFKEDIVSDNYAFLSGVSAKTTRCVPIDILNCPKQGVKSFFKGFCDTESPRFLYNIERGVFSSSIYFLLKKLYNRVSIKDFDGVINFTCSNKADTESGKIKDIKIFPVENNFVYDIETESGRFAAGIGEIIVKNTDSCMIELKTPSFKKYKNIIKEYEDIVVLSDKEKKELDDLKTKVIEESFKIGADLAEEITESLFKKPIELEFEKVYHPFIILSKKRYIGNYYGESPHKIDFVEKKGVVLKRRDNPDIVKKVYTGVVNPLLMHGTRGVKISIDFLKKELYKLMNNDIEFADLVVTKTLAKGYGKLCAKCKENNACGESNCKNGIIFGSGDYKNLNLPHVALANKMRDRDLGSAPVTNDRISYVFVELPDNPEAKLYEKAENLETVEKEKLKIDFLYYVENQLKNPIKEVLALIMKDSDSFFDEFTKEYIEDRKKKIKEFKDKQRLQKGQTSILKWVKH